NAPDTFQGHLLGSGGAVENAVPEVVLGDGGYLLSHVSIEFPSICALDRLPLLIGERDRRNIVRMRDRDCGPPLRHDDHRPHRRPDVTARGRPDGGGVRRRIATPAPRLRGCYRGDRAQASTTTLPASLASALRRDAFIVVLSLVMVRGSFFVLRDVLQRS